jgi:hypothetical protein
VERKSAANEMFNIPNEDWRDKVDAALDSMDAVIVRGDRNDQDTDVLQSRGYNLLCKLT